MRELVVDTAALKDTSLVDLFPFVMWHRNAEFFALQAGKEHYPLLSHLSWQLERGETVLDVGTFVGLSALAFSHNQNIKVVSYDVKDWFGKDAGEFTPKLRKNIEFRLGNVIDDIDQFLECPIIMLDTNHDGTFERELIQVLEAKKFKGVVLCDDIALNEDMKSFWQDVKQTKIDLTDVGHWSGTGIILFDPNVLNVKVT